LIRQIADTIRSNSSVHAQSSKKTFSEDISLQFFIDENYNTTVEGVIELINVSGKDISLTQYDMDLPYFTLKNTRIGYIYPKAFLVDMYSRNNSILFTFKSQYTKPIVVGKNARITFTFSAKVDKPFYEYGGMKILIFPYALTEEGRNVRINVSANKKLPLIFAPQVATTLKEKGLYTVTQETGKLFIFADSDRPLTTVLASSAELPLPALGVKRNCITYAPVSCIGCGDVVKNGENGELVAQRNNSAKSLVFQIESQIDLTCAQQRYKDSSTPQAVGRDFRAGFVLSPITNQLLPATWRVYDDGVGTYAVSYIVLGVPYFYADPFGYLTLPLFTCTSDDDCRAKAESLQPIETSLSSNPSKQISTTSDTSAIEATITQNKRQFYLHFQNTSDAFISIETTQLLQNAYFTLGNTSARLIPPKSSVELPLQTRTRIQQSNHDVTLQIMLNGTEKLVRFKPSTITVLALIELLSYLFITSLGVALVSLLGIFLYTRYYEKKQQQPY